MPKAKKKVTFSGMYYLSMKWFFGTQIFCLEDNFQEKWSGNAVVILSIDD
jgi:hypothetical protein